jgi:hypothetical protein
MIILIIFVIDFNCETAILKYEFLQENAWYEGDGGTYL